MNFKRRIIGLILIAAIMGVIFYGSTQTVNTVEDVSHLSVFSSDKETIYFWYCDDSLSGYIYEAAVSFGEKEGVRVIPVLVSENGYLEKISEAVRKNEQVPDAFIISNDSLEKAYLAGVADVVTDETEILNGAYYPESAVSAVSYHGKKIGYPFYYETCAMVYNATYLDEWARQQAVKELTQETEEGETKEPAEDQEETGTESVPDEKLLEEKTAEYRQKALPDTMSGILLFADTFDAPEGVEGIMEWDVTDIFYNYWFVGNYMIVGGDAGDDIAKIDIDNRETESCLKYYASLKQFFSIESDSVSYESVIRNFVDGKVIFTIGTTDIIKKLAEAEENGELQFEYGIAKMPDVTEELKSRSMSVTNAVVVSSYSNHRSLANRFAAYLSAGQAGDLYAWTEKMPACRMGYDQEKDLNAFYEEYEKSVPLPKLMTLGNFWMNLEALFYEVWNGADVSEKLEWLNENVTVK